ncbi:hypothetical protein [Homoserinibacter sp. GY 40078]|uniref:hypothetical protein n=1 Tax=Homoserinibacter sp. GY 40078 TaxID=2603275 RepID=UPI0011C9F2C8|nr:hypothetical protein [Homoserinibacter sp. GY 40078]TXK16329.1 hypothetical protein FVQ89_13835 [Homoserinibacter sp. GY 40078]
MSDEAASGSVPETEPQPAAEQSTEWTPRAWPVSAIIVAVIFALLTAWFLFQAFGNLINVPDAYKAYGLGDRIPWAVLIAGVALPPLLFAAAALLGMRRALTARVLIFAAALGATAATSFALYALSVYLVTAG